MVAAEIRNGDVAEMALKVRDLSAMVTQQVNEILEEASQERKAPQTVMAYRIPMAGVRYYF